jgi:hypothetical protein
VTPPEPDAPTAYENPLIPNARLRQLYRSILHARLLADSLPPSQRRTTRGLEAALVSTAADLAAHDLVSDALTSPVIAHLRTSSFAALPHDPSSPPLTPKLHAALTAWATPAILPSSPAIAERIWTAIGAAASLKTAAAKSKAYTKAKGGVIRQPGVVVAYTQPNEVAPSLWQKALAFAAHHELPIVFIVLPPPHTKSSTRPTKLSPVIAIALRNKLPGIAADANDPVALYRVAQESIGRARMGGGPALIECVPFAIPGARTPPEDSIPALERYLLHRSAATRAWMNRLEREARTFTLRLASKKK